MNSEDMEFMDIDGPEFIYDVNNEIKNIRDQLHNDHNNYDVFYGSPTVQQQLVPEYYAEIAVLDTNFLLSKLGFLDALIDLANKNPYSLLVILPWVVIRELDGLKNGRADVAVSSRNAMRFIELRLREKQISLRGQKKNEVSDKALLKNDRAKGDDLILDCCMYFQQSSQDKARLLSNDRAPSKITLLSNDRNLCIKAMVHDIQTISAGSILEMEGLLNRIASTKSSNNINLQQQSEPEDLGMDIDDTYAVEDTYYEMMIDSNIPNLITGDSSDSKWAKATIRTRQRDRPGKAYLDDDPELTAPRRAYRPQHTSIYHNSHRF